MAKRGYDDTALIAEIDALMLADPSLSRHAAIKRVAGDSNVRRIEMKMSKRADPLAASHGEILIQTGANPTEMMLVAAERQALAGSKERVRWSGFNDLRILGDRLWTRAIGADYRERLARIDGVAETFFKIAFGFAPFGFAAIVLSALAHAGFRGQLMDRMFYASMGLSLVCMIMGVFGALGTMAWREFRTRPLEQLEEKEAVGFWDTRRYVLTDKALYVLSPEGRSVRVQRIQTDRLKSVRSNGEGDYEVLVDGNVVTLRALPDADVLVTRLGLLDGGSQNAEWMLALA